MKTLPGYHQVHKYLLLSLVTMTPNGYQGKCMLLSVINLPTFSFDLSHVFPFSSRLWGNSEYNNYYSYNYYSKAPRPRWRSLEYIECVLCREVRSQLPKKRWLVVWVLWHINLCWLFNPKSIFKEITSSISNNSVQHEYTAYLSTTLQFQAIQFSQTVLFQTIQFSMNTQLICHQNYYFKRFNLVKQFYFKQFSSAWIHSLFVNNITISSDSI